MEWLRSLEQDRSYVHFLKKLWCFMLVTWTMENLLLTKNLLNDVPRDQARDGELMADLAFSPNTSSFLAFSHRPYLDQEEARSTQHGEQPHDPRQYDFPDRAERIDRIRFALKELCAWWLIHGARFHGLVPEAFNAVRIRHQSIPRQNAWDAPPELFGERLDGMYPSSRTSSPTMVPAGTSYHQRGGSTELEVSLAENTVPDPPSSLAQNPFFDGSGIWAPNIPSVTSSSTAWDVSTGQVQISQPFYTRQQRALRPNPRSIRPSSRLSTSAGTPSTLDPSPLSHEMQTTSGRRSLLGHLRQMHRRPPRLNRGPLGAHSMGITPSPYQVDIQTPGVLLYSTRSSLYPAGEGYLPYQPRSPTNPSAYQSSAGNSNTLAASGPFSLESQLPLPNSVNNQGPSYW